MNMHATVVHEDAKLLGLFEQYVDQIAVAERARVKQSESRAKLDAQHPRPSPGSVTDAEWRAHNRRWCAASNAGGHSDNFDDWCKQCRTLRRIQKAIYRLKAKTPLGVAIQLAVIQEPPQRYGMAAEDLIDGINAAQRSLAKMLGIDFAARLEAAIAPTEQLGWGDWDDDETDERAA